MGGPPAVSPSGQTRPVPVWSDERPLACPSHRCTWIMGVALKVRYGMIHGRFQPFHRGHLEYMRHALQQSEHLIVGITNPDPSLIVEERESAHRHQAEANPFTFFQRLTMVRQVVIDEGIDLAKVSIISFPIHHPERWPFYVPRGVVHFVTVFSDWEWKKVNRLRSEGYRVEVLNLPRLTSATEVRRRLEQGQNWEELVPKGVASVIRLIQQGQL